MSDAQNVFLFVFATMMLALVVELWAIAKVLHKICDILARHSERNEAKEAHRSQNQEGASPS